MIDLLIIIGGIAFAGAVLYGISRLTTGTRREGESEADYSRRKAEDAARVFGKFNENMEKNRSVPTYSELQQAKRTVEAYRSAGVDLKRIGKDGKK